jgi:coatomer subunit beta'
MEEAIDLLIKTDRIPEAAMLARTYAPEQISKIVGLWKAGLESKNRKKTAESLADPKEYPNLFPELLNTKSSSPLVDIETKEEEEEVVEEEVAESPVVVEKEVEVEEETTPTEVEQEASLL